MYFFILTCPRKSGAQLVIIHVHIVNDIPIEENGNLYWYREGKLNRDNDQPAEMYGSQSWYKVGKRR